MEFSIIEKITLSFYFLISIIFFYRVAERRIKIILKNTHIPKVPFGKGIKRVLLRVFSQYALIRQRPVPGLFHAFLFWGFFIFVISTFDMLLSLYGLPSFLEHEFLFFYRFFIDTFALLVTIGVLGLGIRRFFFKSEAITKPRPENEVLLYGKAKKAPQFESFLILLLIFILMVSYLFESASGIKLGIRLSSGKWISSFLLNYVPKSVFFWKLNYFLHLITVFLFLDFIPVSKHFHIFNGIINVFFYNLPSYAYISKLDLEKEDVPWGYSKPEELSFNEKFDAFSCIECGRCQDLCPAYNSGAPLSPKYLIVNTRQILEEASDKILKGEDTGISLVGTAISDEALWSCTTCGACMEACPLDIKHIPYILNIRRSEVLSEGKFPQELSIFFKNMEHRQNPWGLWGEERIKWTKNLSVPFAKDKKEFEYLYFVGCASSFDDRAQKIAKSVVEILNNAGIDYAILGEEEMCNGDPARRAGHEYLFQMMVEANIEIFNKYKFSKILVHCPHCYHVFKHEYPDFGFKKQVVHISELICDLIKKGKLKIEKNKENFTFHDPCYLGRHNGIFEEPRFIIQKLGNLRELKHSAEFSFCCGAGGARMWMETKKGKPVNQVRMNEIKEHGIKNVIVLCPFCLRMLEDAKKEIGVEEFDIMDVTEVIAQKI